MENSRLNAARFSLIIEGDGLPVEEIGAALELEATHVIRRGDVLNRLPLIEAATDEWTYTVPLDNPEGVDGQLNHLLAELILHQEALTDMAARWKVTLRLFVQSDYAQIAYRLMPETLQRLVALGLPLDVSSLSWGEVAISEQTLKRTCFA